MNFNFSQLLDLKGDSAPFSEIRQRIASDASVKGANLVILITAILIASVGLNMNSTAVIIGAMLISPLMGGLVATGYGMATYDMQFIKDSMVKLGFQVSFALITSAIYFSLSPISDASSELLARTSPTIWDVIIALAGGIAGAIGNTRKEKNECHSRRCYCHGLDATALHRRLRHRHAFFYLRTWRALPVLYQRILYHAFRILSLQGAARTGIDDGQRKPHAIPADHSPNRGHRHHHP